MMDLLVPAALSGLTSGAAVFYAMTWRDRTRCNQLEWRIEDLEERMMKRDKQRAGEISVARRKGDLQLAPVDQAFVDHVHQARTPTIQGWWETFTALKEKHGSKPT